MESAEKENMDTVIRNYLEGLASNEEIKKLGIWIESSEDNKKYYQQIKNLWDGSDKTNSSVNVDVNLAFGQVLNRIEKKPEGKKWIGILQKAAAILLLPLVISGYFMGTLNESKKENTAVAFNEIYASPGTRSKVVLPDGTVVWLNSGSKLRYPDKFISAERNVSLSGEAYFEVKSDKSHPFIVEAKDFKIRATGTSFNVQALATENEINVSLLSGKVEVKNSLDQQLASLTPNQQFSFNTQTGTSETFSGDLYEFVAWKDGRIVFRNKPMSEVVKKISQHYNVEIELRGKQLQDYRYRATFEEESLNEILKLLRMSSPIKYSEVDRVLLPNGTFSKRKIIISPL